MISKLDNTPNTEIQVNHESLMHQRRWLTLSPELRQQYVSPSDVEDAIRGAIHAQLENAPLRLLDAFVFINRACAPPNATQR